MATKNDDLTSSMIRHIKRSQKSATILFTDIEKSTQYWEKHGDVGGRLMLDKHNRLMFPVVRRFRGRVVKTIGDSIMAYFRKPQNALRAAVAMQQVLEKTRQTDSSFQLKIRIGIHTGKALVEDQDIFGDVVNVAARVESQAKGDEILISHSAVAGLKKADYRLTKLGGFELKGKSNSITLYRCEWREFEDLTRRIRFTGRLPLVPRQKRELLLYLLSSLGIFYLLYLNYFRYLLADNEMAALIFLDPERYLRENTVFLWAGGVLLAGLLLLIFRIRTIPKILLHFLKGGFGFALGFLLLWLPGQYLNFDWQEKWQGVLFESKHLFVEVLENKVTIYTEPSVTSRRLKQVDKGDLLLLADVRTRYGYTWNKVLIGEREYGWVERVTPPRLGVPSLRVTWADKFYFRYRDLYALILGLVGFLWGWWGFRIKPN
jgi:class 3 adenylate cyclase